MYYRSNASILATDEVLRQKHYCDCEQLRPTGAYSYVRLYPEIFADGDDNAPEFDPDQDYGWERFLARYPNIKELDLSNETYLFNLLRREVVIGL